MALTDAEVEGMKRAVMRYLDEDENASTHLLAKWLNNEFKAVLEWHHIDDARRRWKAREQLLQQNRAAVIPSLTYATPECANCGGEHFISQCQKPFPEKEKTTTPKPEHQEPPMTPQMTPPSPTFHRPPPAVPPPAGVHEHHLGRQKIKGVWIRRAYLNEMLDAEPGADPQALIVKVRERFGIGVDLVYVYETCRIARQIARLPQLPTQDRTTKVDTNGRQALPVFSDPDEAPPLDDEIRQLGTQAREVMRAHGLTGLALNLDESTMRWDYKVERSGSGEAVL